MTRTASRLTVLAATVAALCTTLVSPASAYEGGCTAQKPSGYGWSQSACLVWNDSLQQMVAGSGYSFGATFAGSHVRSCTVSGTMYSSYGTRHAVSDSCTADARRKDSVVNSWYMGAGHATTDYYWFTTCMTVVTGVRTYSTCRSPVTSPRLNPQFDPR